MMNELVCPNNLCSNTPELSQLEPCPKSLKGNIDNTCSDRPDNLG